MANIVNFDTGVIEALTMIANAKKKPILVAVWGPINSGKSYFVQKLSYELREKLFPSAYYAVGIKSTEHVFKNLRTNPENFLPVIIFECAGVRGGLHEWEGEDPNILSKKILKRKIDVNIGIYDSNHFNMLEGKYDILIPNPKAQQKFKR